MAATKVVPSESPATEAVAVTPSDTVDLTNYARSIYVGGVGTVRVDMVGSGASIDFVGVQAGTVLPISVKRIRSTGTTATSIVALR